MTLLKSCLLSAIGALCLSSPALAAPAIWEVRDGDSAIRLFGSFHILPEGTEWRTDLFDGLLADADKVVFETDIRPEALATVTVDSFLRGVYSDGTVLTDRLDDGLEQELRQHAADIGVGMGAILSMRPWMATNLLTTQALAVEGYTELGVEYVLQPELAEERLGFLESGSEQIEVLAGAPEDEQIAMLASTLDQIPGLAKMMDKMLGGWLDGTPEKLASLFVMEMGGFEEAFLDRLLYARNRKWMPALEKMLADNEENLVIVGAAHLVSDSSVIELLEQAGYTVERIQ